MIVGYSIRKSAEIVEINIATSFFWRHKILDCIRSFFGVGSIKVVYGITLSFVPIVIRVIFNLIKIFH